MYNFTRQNPIIAALSATIATSMVASAMYLFFEPSSLFAATDTNTFTVTQSIGAEIAFSTTQNALTMSNSIGGATGGEASSTATVAVTSNDSTGYTIAIKFSDAVAMNHVEALDTIENYGSTTPDYDMNINGQLSGFAYTVSSTNQVAAFNNTGSACGSGSNKSVDHCYTMHGTPTSDFTIVDSSAVATAEQTLVGFKVIVAPSSGLVNGDYVATTTLTASTKV
jgi:hypothetical protein